jgi:hypothetical protein
MNAFNQELNPELRHRDRADWSLIYSMRLLTLFFLSVCPKPLLWFQNTKQETNHKPKNAKYPTPWNEVLLYTCCPRKVPHWFSCHSQHKEFVKEKLYVVELDKPLPEIRSSNSLSLASSTQRCNGTDKICAEFVSETPCKPHTWNRPGTKTDYHHIIIGITLERFWLSTKPGHPGNNPLQWYFLVLFTVYLPQKHKTFTLSLLKDKGNMLTL